MLKQETYIQKNSRGGSRRGISYINNSKYPGHVYPSSVQKTNTNYNESGIMKNSSRPTHESILKGSVKESTNSKFYNLNSHLNYLGDRQKQEKPKYGLINNMHDSEAKAERESRNQQFRIRSNIKENMTNSRKTQKDEQQKQLQKQKQLTQAKRAIERSRLQKQKEQQLNLQKLISERQKQKREKEQREKQQREKQQREKQQREKQQREKQLAKKSSNKIEQLFKKVEINQYKHVSSMTNSTTTGTSDYSSSSLRNGGGSSYTFSTSTSKGIGLVGLNNIGNTCFMNSILQCMFNLPGFNDYFIQNKYESQMKSSARVAQAYANTVKLIRSSTSRSETPSQLKSAIGAKKSRFLGYSQQDAQEFLAALLELLSIDLNRSKNPKYKELTADLSKQSLKQISDDWWNYNKQREDSIVCDFFSGQVLSKVVCSKCSNQSIAFDNIWDMALNFYPNDGGDLLKMIENFLKQETIADDYYCSKCKGPRPCERKIDFYRLPKILVFQLKRFSYGKYRKVKLNNRVRVETTLDLSSLIKISSHSSVQRPIYNLVGVVNHSGDIDFGHYTAECRNPINGKWYDFNDSSVHQIKMREQLESSSPYLLFYAKKDI